MTDRCKLKPLCVWGGGGTKKEKKKKKRNFITHSTGLYLISQEELIRNEKWKKDTISLQEILYMVLEHMQTNTLDILNKASTSEMSGYLAIQRLNTGKYSRPFLPSHCCFCGLLK